MIHNFVHQDGVLGIAAAELEGIAGGHHGAAIVDSGLDCELIACLILVCPLCANLLDNAAEPYRIKTVRNKGYLFAPHAWE